MPRRRAAADSSSKDDLSRMHEQVAALPQVMGFGHIACKGTLGLGGVVRRRILILYVSTAFVRACGSNSSRIFQRICSVYFFESRFLVFRKIPEKSPAESPQCPEQANVGNLQRNPQVSSTGNPKNANLSCLR